MYSQSITDSIDLDQRFINIDNNKTFSTTENLINDSIPKKEPTLLDKVKYNAADYVRINRKESKLILYNEAELYYQDMELRAGIIILDYSKNEVTAGRIQASLGNLIQNPFFKQINNEIYPD